MERRGFFQKALGAASGVASALLLERFATAPVSAEPPTRPRSLAPGVAENEVKPGSFEWRIGDGAFESLNLVVTVAPWVYRGKSHWLVLERGKNPFAPDEYEMAQMFGYWTDVRVAEAFEAWRWKDSIVEQNMGAPASGPLVPGTVFIWDKPGPRYGHWGIVTDPHLSSSGAYPRMIRKKRHGEGVFEGIFAGLGGRLLLIPATKLYG